MPGTPATKTRYFYDRRRGLHRATTRETEMAAMIIASGAMEFLRRSQKTQIGNPESFFSLITKICDYSPSSISQ